MSAIAVTSFYSFSALTESALSDFELSIPQLAAKFGARGLVILAKEGINASISVAHGSLRPFQMEFLDLWGRSEIEFKDSFCSSHPFKKLSVKIKEELVTSGGVQVLGRQEADSYLSPEEWHQLLLTDTSVLILDTRNDYECELGKFRGARHGKIESFTEFSRFVETSGISRDTKILTYCTGGIRCEKAVPALRELGFSQVFQLDGGIIRYLEQYPNGLFEGECFVFDERVAVRQDLKPSDTYRFCLGCGDPCAEKQQCIGCERILPWCAAHCATQKPAICSQCAGRAEYAKVSHPTLEDEESAQV